jgi:ribosomal protein S8E
LPTILRTSNHFKEKKKEGRKRKKEERKSKKYEADA